MKRNIITSFISLLIFFTVNAQDIGNDYKTALGIKYYPVGISIKSFTSPNIAFEGLAYFWDYGTRFTGLYEIHHDINGLESLKWYAGPGVHIGFWNDTWKNKFPDRSDGVAIGIDFVFGLDYKFSRAPVNLSLDWQPSFTFVGYNYFEGGWGGLGIRYTF